MEQSILYTLFIQFSEDDRRKIRKWLISPFFNPREEVKYLFKFLEINANKPAALDELLIDRNVDAVRLDSSNTFEGVAIGTALGRVAQALLIDGELGHDTSALYLRAPDAVLPKPHARYGKAEYSKPVLAGGGAE